MLLAAAVLTATACLRGAEYDEQYTLFLTGGTARPLWPDAAFPAELVTRLQSGRASLATIAADLRRTDVHPPLYFWAVSLWRAIAGDGLLAARLLSVGCGLGALAAIGAIARRTGLSPALAMLLTLGCYGFAYTGGIARGFALAQLLSLMGVASLLAKRDLLAGALLGAAVASNYLAMFVAAVVLALARSWGRAAAGFAPFALLAGWFFIAQRGSRIGQFPPFEPWPALARIARYGAANLTGGLPLYVPEPASHMLAVALATGLAGLGVLVAIRWRHIATPPARRLFAAAALAPPIGLLLLGLAFNNTPIELRYLSFATPFVGLLLAGALRGMRVGTAVLLAVQAASLAGLMLRPETMQPAQATASAAAALAGDGPILIPRGNDGVGIVGAFATGLPPDARLLIIGPDLSAADIRNRTEPFHRVTLALLEQDADSRTAVLALRAAFAHPGWRVAAIGSNVIAYERISGAR